MDYVDSGIRIIQTALPPALQYFGRAKEREAKLVQTEDDLAQTRAVNDVLVMKNHELRKSESPRQKPETKNQELARANASFEAFRNIVLILIAIAVVAYAGMTLAPTLPE